jgi:hypothetical protein
MVLFFINTVIAIFLLFKYPLVMKRSVTDACLELQASITTEEQTEEETNKSVDQKKSSLYRY